jgi:predicted dehydrogenase
MDAVAIAVPPRLQPEIAIRALDLRKPVFAEKPLAADLAGGEIMLRAAQRSGRPTIVDFNFPELSAWRRAHAMLKEGCIGALRHAVLTWNVENPAVRLGLKSWKTAAEGGGGVLGNFVSHCFYNLEWLCGPMAGPIAGLGGRVFELPGSGAQASVAWALTFAGGAGGSLQMSCASFLGSGHRIELYGDDGTLVLVNPSQDYFRNFTLRVGRRGEHLLQEVPTADESGAPDLDSRIAPSSRLVKRFVDACEGGACPSPGFAAGYRVQQLIDAARRAHASGCWIETRPAAGEPQA